MAVMTYPKVLQLAKELPPEAQLELAEALLYNLRANLPLQEMIAGDEELVPIIGLTHTELQALADAVVAADRQQQIKMLLAKNRQETLTPDEESMLDALLSEADQVALLKARALYTMKIFGLSSATNL